MNFNWTVRVRTAQGTNNATFRNHSISVGQFLSFDQQDRLPSALETALAALASEVADSFATLCRKRRLELDALETTLNATLENPLMAVGVVGEQGTPALEAISLVVYCSSDHSADTLQPVFETALARCPLLTTLQRACRVDVRFVAQL